MPTNIGVSLLLSRNNGAVFFPTNIGVDLLPRNTGAPFLPKNNGAFFVFTKKAPFLLRPRNIGETFFPKSGVTLSFKYEDDGDCLRPTNNGLRRASPGIQ